MAGGDIKAGGAFVTLGLRGAAFEKGLRRLSRKFTDFGAKVGKLGSRIAGLGVGIGAAFVPAIRAASDMQETMSKFDTVFGSAAASAKAWSDGLARDVGRSKQQIASFMAGSQDLFVPLGFEAGTATDLSKQLTTLAIDLASFNNMADADVLRDLQAALTGSGEVMKKYGVIVSEAAVKQQLLQSGIDPKKATDQQKVMARLQIIMAGTTAAQGDAIRTGDSFANQMKRLNAVFMDTQVAIGEAVLPAVTAFVSKAASIGQQVAGWVEQNKGLVVSVAKIAVVVAGIGAGIAAFGAAVSAAGVILGGLASAFAVLSSPILIAIGAVVGVGAALISFTNAGQQVAQFMSGTFLDAWQGMVDAMQAGSLAQAGQVGWTALQKVWATGITALQEAWLGFSATVQNIFEQMFVKLIEIGAPFFSLLGRGLAKIGEFTGLDIFSGVGGELSALGQSAESGELRKDFERRRSEREAEVARQMEELRVKLEGANTAFTGATEKAREMAEAAKLAALDIPKVTIPDIVAAGTAAAQASEAAGTQGTFSARAAAQLGGFATKGIEKNTADTAETLKRIEQQLSVGGGLGLAIGVI